MNLELLSYGLDVLILIFLAVMIFYAFRLTYSLNEFRKNRNSFDEVIGRLVVSIDQAEKSIKNLKEVSANEAGNLQSLVKNAKALSLELQDINQISETMANRLENLASENRKIISGEGDSSSYEETLPKRKSLAREDNQDLPSFMIHDNEDNSVHDYEGDHDIYPDDMSDELQSEAEKELYKALKGREKRSAGGGRS
ncbi:MAG: DUF6468 domain-containing protein [Alphaproteobacteria bacterium]|nr:DUF6468 domain-containing protein [Alphaproteobacteria bacterium]